MEVPSSVAGVVKELKVKVGDTCPKAVVALIEAEGEAATPPAAPAAAKAAPAAAAAPAPTAAAAGGRSRRVPDIGDYHDAGHRVLVPVGDTVKKDQGLVTLESDKATWKCRRRWPAWSRRSRSRSATPVAGRVVALIEAEAPADGPRPAQPARRPPAVEAAEVPDRRPPARSRRKKPTRALGRCAGTPPVQFNADGVLPAKVPYASPAVRVFARELGVDLLQVNGTEKAGRITKEDVQKLVKAALSGGAPVAGGAAVPAGGGLNLLPWPKVDFASSASRSAAAVAHQEDLRRQPGPQLGDDPARHPVRAGRHHRAGSLRVQLNKENEKAAASS
jgi:pyruvate dehydrogenase E2 component (dihydrolipoamide acetyltransferase)